jgi:hypothetical protein
VEQHKVWFVVVYANHWGRGHSVEEAKRLARKAGGGGREWYAKRLPLGVKDPYVDDFGHIRWGFEDGVDPDTIPNTACPIVAKGPGVAKSRLQAPWQPELAL